MEVHNMKTFENTREFESNLIAKKRDNNRYIQKINDLTLESSRRFKSMSK